jgi:8-oxo-dGTP diphosphatase
MTYPRHKTIEVAAGLIFQDGRLLIAQRCPGDHLGGFWEFPGGKREVGETFQQCLMRELHEELGVHVEVGRRLAVADHPYPERRIHIEFYQCRLVGTKPRPIACAKIAWVTAGDLGGYKFPEADASLLEQLRQDPSLWAG